MSENSIYNVGMRFKGSAITKDDCVRLYGEDASGVEYSWVMRVRNFMEAMPSLIKTASDVQGHYTNQNTFIPVMHIKDIGLGQRQETLLTLVLEQGMEMNISIPRDVSKQLSQALISLEPHIPANG